MRRKVLAAAILALAAVPGLAAAQSRKGTPAKKKPAAALNPTVQVAGLRVVGPGFGPEDDRKSAFFGNTGTTVVVAVRVPPPYSLVEIDKDNSSLEMTDSQGTALDGPEVDWSPDFTKDGTTALVDLEAKGVPADGSSYVALKGSLMFKVSSGVKTIKAPKLTLEKGTPVKMGTAAMTISDVEVEEGSDGPLVSFKGTRAVVKQIKAVRAKDAKGAPIEVHWSQSGGWDEEYQIGYRFKMAGKGPVNVEFDVFDGLRDVAIPFELKAGVAVPVQ